jgi:hypothetical protein
LITRPEEAQLLHDTSKLFEVHRLLHVRVHTELVALDQIAFLDLDAMIRRVGRLPHPIVPAYTAVDVRYAWRVRPDVEVSLVGQNLFDRSHPEFNASPGRAEFERGIFLRARWSR